MKLIAEDFFCPICGKKYGKEVPLDVSDAGTMIVWFDCPECCHSVSIVFE